MRAIGIAISKRQIVRLLIAGKESFVDEARDVLRAGLTTAARVTVDDTGARHKGANGFCMHIPRQVGHRFQRKPATDSDEGGHP